MRRVLLSVCAALLAAGSGAAIAATAPAPGDASQQCYAQAAAAPDNRMALPCRLGEGVTNQAGADCRVLDDTDDQCAAIDGRDISAAEIAAYQRSWVHHALSLQRGIDATAPLMEEQIPHTHNTFNGSAYAVPRDGSQPSYYPTLTNQDPNQVYSISDQLDMDVRAIELDLHWVPSPYGTPDTHGYWVTMCHGDGQQVPQTGTYVHVGCTDDRPAQDGFAEVASWLKAHPDQFLLVYLENQLYDASPVASATQAHDVAATLLRQAFGSLVYRPTGVAPGRCATLPYGTSRAQMMATGARVLLVGNCGPGSWSSWVFDRNAPGRTWWDEGGDPRAYAYPSTACSRDRALRAADVSFRREYEDSTFVSAATGDGPQPAMSAANVAAMVRCGVNIIGLDQLRPQDGRLAALVWSWAVNEPGAAGDCAEQASDGRFYVSDCSHPRPAACRSADGAWHVTSTAVPWRDAFDACSTQYPGSSFGLPVNGYRNDVLRAAHLGTNVWLDYAKVNGAWTPFAPRPATGSGGGEPSGDHGRHLGWGRGRGHGGDVPRRASLR
jgi:hypothetical protein